MTKPKSNDTLPDIARTCPFCQRAFKDTDFASITWLDDHTPAHLHCTTNQPKPTQQRKETTRENIR